MRSTARAASYSTFACCAIAALLSACQPRTREVSHTLAAFGTLVTLRYYGVPTADAERATAELEASFQPLQKDWYPWADGELKRINMAIANGEATPVSAPLAGLLQRASELERRSNGLFNPALGGLTELWGFNDILRDNWRPPSASEVAAYTQPPPSSTSLQWSGLRLESRDPRVVLDPGGIAKGAILADAARRLRARGIDNAIIDIGGDLLVAGRAGQRPARIGIRKPGSEEAIAWLEAESGEAVLTSGNYERYFEYAGTRYMHVLDPRSGQPATESASVTVVSRDPVLADAAATALLVAGSAGFEKLCADLGIDDALLITANGDLRLTPSMAGRVHWLSEQ